MKIQTSIKAGGREMNHNQTLVQRTQTHVKAGALTTNHNQTLVRYGDR